MKGKLVRLLIASIVLGLVLSWGYGSPADVARAAPASASDFTFGQLDWYDDDDILQIEDSSWGYMEVDVVGHPTQLEYLNVTADAGSGEAWIVQNLPIFPDTIGNASPRQGVDFDITLLGLSSGTDLTSLDFVYTVDGGIRLTAPSGPMSAESVADIERRSFGSQLASPPLPVDVGAPAGVQIQDAVKNVIQHKDVPGVQELTGHCLYGAFARSIAWLLGKKTDADAQKIYDEIVAAAVPIGPGSYKKNIEIKDGILKGKKPGAVTKILDLKNAIPKPNGIDEDTTSDLIAWLKKELPTEDVELHYDNHIVTVTGMFESGGKTFIKYRDDETQGNKSEGDKAEKTGEIWKDAEGNYAFRRSTTDKFFWAQGAISESPPGGGGIAEAVGGDSPDASTTPAGGPGSPAPPYAAVAGGAAAAVAAIAAGGWYARRRFSRG
jgi:hypothetical protein